MAVTSFRDLVAWQRAMDLVEEVYRVTACFPRSEQFALTNQLRRAVVSVPSNIAEGQGRGEGPDFLRFLRVARGSLQEVLTQLLVAERLGYIDSQQIACVQRSIDDVGKLVSGLMRAL